MSLIAAYVLFGILSSTGFFIGFGGAAAGFFASMHFFKKWYEQMLEKYEQIIAKEKRANRKLYIINNFNRQDTYKCKYWVFDEETGDEKEFSSNYRWEAGYMTLDIREVGSKDLIMVSIEDSQNVWKCDYFYSCVSRIEVNLEKKVDT